MAAEPSAKKRKEDKKKKCFRWTDEMHTSLIEALKEYKVSCEYNTGVDFDADKTLPYKKLQKEMAKCFNTKDSLFGPVDVSERPGELNEDEKKTHTTLQR